MLLWILLAVLGQSEYEATNELPAVEPALCPAGTEAHGEHCLHCQVGFISMVGTACFACPAGKIAPVAGSTHCTECAAGTFSHSGNGYCDSCPTGTTSLAGSVSLSACTTLMTPVKSPQEPEEYQEWIDDDEKAPLSNALELHNEAELAQERAEEAEKNADREVNEANEAYEQKMEKENELHEAEERFDEVFDEKTAAEEAKHNAEIRYKEQAMEAEHAVEKSSKAQAESAQAALRAFEASHAMKMESEGEANEAVVQSKIEDEEHFYAQMQYREAEHHAMKQSIEADQAREAADKAVQFAAEQNAEAEMAEAKLLDAESHLKIQKEEADEAKMEAEKAVRDHEIAAAHHQTVLASKEKNEEVWEEMNKDDCVDDPKGLVSSDPTKNCDDVGSITHWSCDHFDEDFNGHATFIWELCPVSCDMCGTDRDQYYEEHHHHDDKEDDMPECLKDCPFEGLDIDDPETACPWWHAEGPEHKTNSCFNDCSPGVMFYVEHHVEKVCHGGPDENPFECAMDCPIEGLDPHSAESFCPWFSEQQENMCFNDCADKFLNMAQAHAEHTCVEFVLEGADKFTSYITEPLAEALIGNDESPYKCEGGFYRSATMENECKVCPATMYSLAGDYECSACPAGLTSFPGSDSPNDCFVRASLPVNDSDDSEPWESEENLSWESEDMESYEHNDEFQELEEEKHQDTNEPEFNYNSAEENETYEPESEYKNSVQASATTYPIHQERPIEESEKFVQTQTAVTGEYAYTAAPEYYNPTSEFPVNEEYPYVDYSATAQDDYSKAPLADYAITTAPYYPTAENEADLSYTGQPTVEGSADLSTLNNP